MDKRCIVVGRKERDHVCERVGRMSEAHETIAHKDWIEGIRDRQEREMAASYRVIVDPVMRCRYDHPADCVDSYNRPEPRWRRLGLTDQAISILAREPEDPEFREFLERVIQELSD